MAIIRHNNPAIVYTAPPTILSHEEKQAMAKGRLKASPSARPYRAVTRGGWIQAQAAATQA